MTGGIDPEAMRDLAAAALEDGKAENVVVLDVREITSIADYMVIATGRSQRQVKALKDRVLERLREYKVRPIGVEGEQGGEWVLIDFGDVIVHTMRPETREHYQLEKLWDRNALRADAAPATPSSAPSSA